MFDRCNIARITGEGAVGRVWMLGRNSPPPCHAKGQLSLLKTPK
jgi:hypothetical protein